MQIDVLIHRYTIAFSAAMLMREEKQILRVYQRARETAITSILISAICGEDPWN